MAFQTAFDHFSRAVVIETQTLQTLTLAETQQQSATVSMLCG